MFMYVMSLRVSNTIILSRQYSVWGLNFQGARGTHEMNQYWQQSKWCPSQITRYIRACSSYDRFILRMMRLWNRFIGKGFAKERLKLSLGKFFGRYAFVPLSGILYAILGHGNMQWDPLIIRHNTCRPCYRGRLFTKFSDVSIRAFSTGAAWQQMMLTPLDTWSCPISDFHVFLCWD